MWIHWALCKVSWGLMQSLMEPLACLQSLMEPSAVCARSHWASSLSLKSHGSFHCISKVSWSLWTLLIGSLCLKISFWTTNRVILSISAIFCWDFRVLHAEQLIFFRQSLYGVPWFKLLKVCKILRRPQLCLQSLMGSYAKSNEASSYLQSLMKPSDVCARSHWASSFSIKSHGTFNRICKVS